MTKSAPVCLLALAVACGARTELGVLESVDASVDVKPHDAGHDVHDAAIDAPVDAPQSSPLCVPPDAGKPTSVCTVDVQVQQITLSMQTCFVDTVVHEGDQGFVNYACNGDTTMWAGANFPGGSFAGSVNGTNVDLCTGTTFAWSDGCTWASAQKITGDVTSGTLSFVYEEEPIEGGPCQPPCSAQGTILVK